MLRIRRRSKTKRALTLVELVVAMALTSIFAGLCVLLIVPVSKIYTHVNELNRAQLIADTVVDALRNECSGTFIKAEGDVYVLSSNEGLLDAEEHDFDAYGNILVLRKTKRFYETISSNYSISAASYGSVYAFENEGGNPPETGSNGYTSRSVYGMFPSGSEGQVAVDAQSGYVHFGFFERPSGEEELRTYDFTNPFGYATYQDYSVRLNFHQPVNDVVTGLPAYVICDVSVLNSLNNVVYTRTVVLCFDSPVVQ